MNASGTKEGMQAEMRMPDFRNPPSVPEHFWVSGDIVSGLGSRS